MTAGKTRKNKWFALAAVCAVAVVLFFGSGMVFKITNPADPRFDPAKFRFENYKTQKELDDLAYHVLPYICKVGVKEEHLDKTFVRYGGAKKIKSYDDQYLYRYSLNDNDVTTITGDSINIRVFFDPQKKITRCFTYVFGMTGACQGCGY